MTVHILEFLLGYYLKWVTFSQKAALPSTHNMHTNAMPFSQSLCVNWQSLIARGRGVLSLMVWLPWPRLEGHY